MSRGIVGGDRARIDVRVDVFFAELAVIREVRRLFNEDVELGPMLTAQLHVLKTDREERQRALADPRLDSSEALATELRETGFQRELMEFQLENLAALLRLPHGADFSVPGAGKTTVALANYALNRSRGLVEQLLVVSPLAAFEAWKEDNAACFTEPAALTVHGGPDSLIPDDATFLVTNYNRVASDYDRIRAYTARRPTQVILDEAHRIKRGHLGVHGRAVLDLAFPARRRDVLTGTPAPQGAFDLVALVRFLYPGQDRQILPAGAYIERDGREEHVLEETARAVARYFVRTPKSRLGLPPTTSRVLREPMSPIQHAIYEALRGRYRGDVASRRHFDRLGRIVMYLLEAAVNPMLLVAGSHDDDELGFAHPPLELRGDEQLITLLERYRDFETPWKYERVRDIVGESGTDGKTIVWSTFVRNLRALSKYLPEHQPAVVHGGIPQEDSAPRGAVTREQELDRFRHDPDCRVLLANPAACGEGISLHHWCHHAVYLDRTFNAGHYLQSQDRIHRLGLREGQVTRFTLLLSEGSVDDTVDQRLRDKVTALGRLMNDPGLVRVALPEPDEHQNGAPVFTDDDQAIQAHLASAVIDAP
jgi:SNF2 family DNA or RNA helicase